MTSCGAPGNVMPEPSPTVSLPSVEPTESPSPSPSASPTPSASPMPTPPANSGAPSLQPGSDVHLKLSDFLASGSWEEGSFAVPRVGDIAGIGGSIDACSEDWAGVLEFRADGDYAKFFLTAAPGRKSEDSSKTLVVALYNGGDFIDSIKIPYGKIGSFKGKDISEVSALKIKVWTEGECTSSDVFAVLYDIHVSP